MAKKETQNPNPSPAIDTFNVLWVPPDTITPYERNPRIIKKDAIDAVKTSLDRYGWQQPIVVDKNHVIIVGHTRLQAAKERGDLLVPIRVAENLTEEQAREYRLIDNKSGEKSAWDWEMLALEMPTMDTTLPVFQMNYTKTELDAILQVNWDSNQIGLNAPTGGGGGKKATIDSELGQPTEEQESDPEIYTIALDKHQQELFKNVCQEIRKEFPNMPDSEVVENILNEWLMSRADNAPG